MTQGRIINQQEIIARRQEIDRKINELKLEIEKEKIGYKYIQLECTHPDGYEYSIMGRETGWRCPDCSASK